MEIYIDVYIAENIFVDMFLLIITGKIMKFKIANSRLILASILGGLYSCVMVLPKLKVFSLIPFQIFVAFIMIWIVLENSTFVLKLKGIGLYLISALSLSGLCFTFSLWQNSFSINTSYILSTYSLKYLILSIIIIYVVFERVISYLKERVMVSGYTYDIEISLENYKYLIKGFLDTGNELREPVTNLPCIIVEQETLNECKIEDDRKYYIPYSAIGFNGKLIGFKVDKVRIKREGETWREIQAIICPCKDILSRDRDYNALLSRGVI